jgi:hypothetical protein
LVRARINHITKTEFLSAFIDAFNASIRTSQIQGGFRGAGLIPFNPEIVLEKLDIRLKTPPEPPQQETTWTSKTPKNSVELASQSTLVIKKFTNPHSSSPIGPTQAFETFVKGTQLMAHQFELMKAQISELQAENSAYKERKSRKRKRLQTGGILDSEQAKVLLAAEANGAKCRRLNTSSGGIAEGSGSHQRRCRRCRKVGHNSRTCAQVEQEASESDASTHHIFSSCDAAVSDIE